MMKKFLIALAFIAPSMVFAAGGKAPLEKANIDLTDKASLQNGAKLYMNYCLGCHELSHQRYERTFNDIGVPVDEGKKNLILGNDKVGSLITNAMDSENAAIWFGAPPPDLTLESRLRGVDWIYTYLKSFYHDPARPFKVNNVVFPDVGMPHVLQELQGRTRLEVDSEGHKTIVADGSGEMSADEYDKAITDLVNFLAYVGEPSKLESESLGSKVIIFLLVLLGMIFLLKKEFWKDIH